MMVAAIAERINIYSELFIICKSELSSLMFVYKHATSEHKILKIITLLYMGKTMQVLNHC